MAQTPRKESVGHSPGTENHHGLRCLQTAQGTQVLEEGVRNVSDDERPFSELGTAGVMSISYFV